MFNTVGIYFVLLLNITIYLIICITQSKCIREREQGHFGSACNGNSDIAIADSATDHIFHLHIVSYSVLWLLYRFIYYYSVFWLLCRPSSADGSFVLEACDDDDQLKGGALRC